MARKNSQFVLMAALTLAGCGGSTQSAPMTPGAPGATPKASSSGSGDDDDSASASGSTSGDDDDQEAAVKKATVDWLADTTEMTDDEAIKYIKAKCGSCHDAKSGNARSFWPLNKDSLTRKTLEADSITARVYYTVLLGAKQIAAQTPSAMPIGTAKWKASQIDELKRLVKWFEVQLPAAAQSGQQQFGKGKSVGDNVGVTINYTCPRPSTFRQYLNRLAQDAFSRNATPEEMKLATGDLDKPVGKAERKKIAARILTDAAWKKEFVEHGLKKFADKIAGANDISKLDGQIDEAQAADLRVEFYQKLVKGWETTAFKDMLLTNKVMVSPNTAKLYEGCTAANGWSECEMQLPRDSFFSTIGYLRSKQSSFLAGNNNYGRAALMHFIVRGDVFRNANDQPGGSEVLKPLPACLVSKDYRVFVSGTNVAPLGSMAVPTSANLCQSCHIERQMAAGSMLFRPFNFAGLLYKTGDKILDMKADPLFATANDVKTVKLRPKGTLEKETAELDPGGAFLQSLLDDHASGKEVACTEGGEGEKDVIFKTVGDLAKFLIGDGAVLAGGLARHIPRSISNLDMTSEEIVIKFNLAFADGKGKLGPLFEAYFGSETFACEKE